MEETIMPEEKKVQEAEVAEVEEVKAEQQPAEQPQEGLALNDKNALIAFILAVVGAVVCSGWFIGGVAGIVLAAISMKFNKKGQAGKNPFIIFQKIAKPVAIVVLILSIVLIVVWAIVGIVQLVAIAAAAAEAMAESV